jgi:hypothetical protein
VYYFRNAARRLRHLGNFLHVSLVNLFFFFSRYSILAGPLAEVSAKCLNVVPRYQTIGRPLSNA